MPAFPTPPRRPWWIFPCRAARTGTTSSSAGSIAGGGIFYLGASQLTVGGNGLSTQVTGIISDCAGGAGCENDGAIGGSLVKTGAGTLTLSGHRYLYTGATLINDGVLGVERIDRASSAQ